jgi:MFS family permease
VLTPEANKGRLRTLLLTTLCLTVQAVPLAGLPLLLPLIRQDLGFTYAQAGILGSANMLVYAMMQIPGGYLSDRYSPRKMVVIGALGMMGLSLLLAIVNQYWQLLVLEFLWGFFGSFIFSPAMSLFIRWFSAERRSFATSLPVVGAGLGILAVNLLFPLIVNRTDSWRPPFVIFGAVGIIFAFALLIWGRDVKSKGLPAQFNLALIREVFRYQQVLICYGLQFIRFAVVQGIIFWLPSLLVNEKQFSLQLAGVVIAVQSIVTASSNIFGGYLADRSKKSILIIATSMIMLVITTVLLVALDPWGLVIAAVMVNAVFLQAYFGPLFTLVIEVLGPERPALQFVSRGSPSSAVCLPPF